MKTTCLVAVLTAGACVTIESGPQELPYQFAMSGFEEIVPGRSTMAEVRGELREPYRTRHEKLAIAGRSCTAVDIWEYRYKVQQALRREDNVEGGTVKFGTGTFLVFFDAHGVACATSAASLDDLK